MAERRVGLLGATSLVGSLLLPLLARAGWQVEAFSRCEPSSESAGVTWRILPSGRLPQGGEKTEYWICVAPIWVLPQYFDLLEACGARRVVALSSTSLFTKGDSSDSGEQAIAVRLATGEGALRAWSEAKGVEWVILRPTLIYGCGRDRNIAEMARFMRRFGFFPLLGRAGGLRQPVYAEDVASACLAALVSPQAKNRAYNLSGGETLSYRDMASRVFVALRRRPMLVMVPLWAFRLVLVLMRLLPRYRHWSAAMAERMNRDLVFDHADAERDLGYVPRAFRLAAKDLPS
ncbi:MAG: NAD-dependent epimerase/dehydratase family protein [Sulfuricella sp.]|nr:NAD-dependent epimerase/dehydratase family protein [Sulfuricella sp.]